MLDLFLIDKALYELRYELNNRPEWVRIPMRGLEELG
jgi:maltose alpha-D-glucosyltransferase/alpha-amylase